MRLRTGTDLASIDLMRHHITMGEVDYTAAFLTSAELRTVGGSVRRITGRWAAKEAAMKALGIGLNEQNPLEIEIETHPSGDPQLHLRGQAHDRATALGLDSWDVSITYEGDLAMAVVVAIGRG